MKKIKRTRWQLLHELLGLYGQGKITTATFWAHMEEHGLKAEDIDWYCDESQDRQAAHPQDR